MSSVDLTTEMGRSTVCKKSVRKLQLESSSGSRWPGLSVPRVRTVHAVSLLHISGTRSLKAAGLLRPSETLSSFKSRLKTCLVFSLIEQDSRISTNFCISLLHFIYFTALQPLFYFLLFDRLCCFSATSHGSSRGLSFHCGS